MVKSGLDTERAGNDKEVLQFNDQVATDLRLNLKGAKEDAEAAGYGKQSSPMSMKATQEPSVRNTPSTASPGIKAN